MTEKRTCPVCGEKFEPKTHNHKICSQRCANWRHKDANLFSVFYRDNFRCRYCGKTPADGVKLTLDRVYPKSRGGQKDKTNLVTACKSCNSHKGDKVWDEDLIKEIWWQNEKLSQNKSKKNYKEMIEEFKDEFPDEPLPHPSSV